MYCIECGAKIEATARVCSVCMFEQPLEEFPDAVSAAVSANSSQKIVQPIRFVEQPRQGSAKPKVAAAIAAIVALCLSVAIASYLLTRQTVSTSESVPDTPRTDASPACIESGQYESAGEDLSWHQLARQGSGPWACEKTTAAPDALAAQASQGDKTVNSSCERKASDRLVEVRIDRDGTEAARFYLGQARCEAARSTADGQSESKAPKAEAKPD